MLAVIAGAGLLPRLILEENPGLLVRFEGAGCETDAAEIVEARFEQLGVLFGELKSRDVTDVCFAGAMARPALDPSSFDPETLALMPRVLPVLKGGDDALLRLIAEIFEEQGFAVRGAHELAPGLVAPAGSLVGEPDAGQKQDAARATAILNALSEQDVGQGCVVANGLCLGIETIQGTDAMLGFVADTRARHGDGGVFVKRPKAIQDLRIDMPAIGPETVVAVAAAGLSGMCIAAGSVLLLDRPAIMDAAVAAGIVLWAE